MNIWLINHYAVPPKYYPLARQTYFAKYLQQMGHTVTIFAASAVHNSDINLITDKSLYKDEIVDGVHYVYIRCKSCKGNGLKRILNMCEFARKLPKVCKRYARPDAIVATSMPPMSCAKGIKLAKKYGCIGIAEIADLWPESLIAYGIAGKHNPLVIALRWLEKWIYKKADGVVFTMEGAYDYIKEQGWEKAVPKEKTYYINNGVDIALFDQNREQYKIEDDDLYDSNTFKVVYAGSVRIANGPQLMIDTAEYMKDLAPDVKFLIFGAGEDLEGLRAQCVEKGLTNIVFKGAVAKTMIPSILAASDMNLLNYDPRTIQVYRFGSSQNKLFEYLASGKPILSTVKIAYSIVKANDCGIEAEDATPQAIAEAILQIKSMTPEQRKAIEENCRKTAEEYDFKVLTEKLMSVIEKYDGNE